MYIVLVVLQTAILPVASTVVQILLVGGDPFVVAGIWWGFWGVGTRLAVAGISQLANPSRTAKGILGIEDAGADQVVHELGYANLSLGIVALAAPFVPVWGILTALPGALYLGLAGVRHIAKKNKGAEEIVATWTDLLVFVAVGAGLVAVIGSVLAP
ncbi:hypothetical protein AB0N73_01595 [Microbacterium sp. NPDC089189]|uniref:hypothetical protein n=1 Tax=Microbacterium sp. NPDC089189 TaxID=3154972 RepID=UPI00342288FB